MAKWLFLSQIEMVKIHSYFRIILHHFRRPKLLYFGISLLPHTFTVEKKWKSLKEKRGATPNDEKWDRKKLKWAMREKSKETREAEKACKCCEPSEWNCENERNGKRKKQKSGGRSNANQTAGKWQAALSQLALFCFPSHWSLDSLVSSFHSSSFFHPSLSDPDGPILLYLTNPHTTQTYPLPCLMTTPFLSQL